VFGELGYHDASIVKVAEAAGVAAGTFYLYFDSKKAIFDELVRDLNRRVRHAMKEASSQGETRLQAELRGFRGVLPLTAEHPTLVPDHPARRSFVSPEMLRYHYDVFRPATSRRSRKRPTRARSASSTPRSRPMR